MELNNLIETLKNNGVGRRCLSDGLFQTDNPLPVFTIYDIDDETLCHEIVLSSCPVINCHFTSESLLEFENHYNALHRYSCSECRKTLPSPHLLDLHIQEKHDSFFAVASEKKPLYKCYIEECQETFWNADERISHCVDIHKLPKNFRFEQVHTKPKKTKPKKGKVNNDSMVVDGSSKENPENKMPDPIKKSSMNFSFKNMKAKTFALGNRDNKKKTVVNIDTIMTDLKDSLPE